MARNYFSAEVIEVGDGKELENGGFVLNIDICHKAETILGEEEFEPRMTMFGRKAGQALEKLKEGVNVVFTGVKRNPRSWISDSGKLIQQVELTAEGFKVIKQEDFKDTVTKIIEANKMFDVELLEFTDADEKALEKEGLVKKDADKDEDVSDLV